MTSIRRALALSLAERYVLIAISLAGNIVLARLLTPEEIGIYSVSLAVIGIAQVLRDFGLGNFLIQEKNLSEAHIRTAFGISLVMGSGLFLIVTLGADWASRYYAEERIMLTLRISAMNFLVLPFCSISVALLRREMLFKSLVTVTLTSAVVGFGTTISLALLGYGANSMAIGSVAANIATGIGAWLARSDRKLLLPSFSEWRVLLEFGGQSAAANVVTSISMDINDLFLGKILGFSSVAMISRAQGLMNIFHRDLMSAIRNVAYPAFAKAHRDGEQLESNYIASVSAVTVLAWPFYGFTALFSLELLRLMFGPQWDQASPLVPIFCLAGAFAASSTLISSAIMATGRIDLITKTELIFQPLRAALVISSAIFYKSLLACAIAYLVSFIFWVPLMYSFKSRCIPNNFRALSENLLKSAKVTIFTLVLPAGMTFNAGFDRSAPVSFLFLVAAALISGFGWVSALVIFKHSVTSDPLFKRLTEKLLRLK